MDIIAGIPHGSILVPLMFNIYLNDIFHFIDESKSANYADNNTPYSIECSVESVINRLGDMPILLKWFEDNFFLS